MTQHGRVKLSWLIGFLISIAFFSVGCQAFASTYTFKGTLLDPAKPLPDIELTTSEGTPFHLSDTAGDITLIYFGYTFCPDVCPLTLADVKQALNQLEAGRERVHVVFISLDPERDTPETLSRYLAAFDSSYIGLTDTLEKTEAVKSAFGVFSEKAEVPDSAAIYLVNHTSRLFLINPQGELALLYSFGFAPEDLRSDLEHLLEDL